MWVRTEIGICALIASAADPFPGHRGDRPGSGKHAAVAVSEQPERAARFTFEGPRAGDRLGELDLGGGEVDAAFGSLGTGQADSGGFGV